MVMVMATVTVMVVGEVMREPVRSWLRRHGVPVAAAALTVIVIVTVTVTVTVTMVVATVTVTVIR